MKKFLLPFLLLLCLGTSAVAQTQRGSKLIGGSGTLHLSTDDSPYDYTSVSLMPRLGFFLADNLAVGAAVPLLYASSDIQKNTAIGISPFLRGYFGQSATRLFVEGRMGITHYDYDAQDGPYSYSESNEHTHYGLGVGAAHFINEYVGLELLLSYDKADTETGNYLLSNNSGINLNIGLQIHLPRKE